METFEPRLALAAVPLVSILTETGASLVASSKPVELAEGSAIHASVRLTRRPTHDILVSFRSFDPLDLAVDRQTLRFTPSNWNQPQNVDFKAVDDGSADGNQPLPVLQTVSIAGRPAVHKLISRLQFNTIDSGITTYRLPSQGTYQGTIDGVGASGTVTANWANGKGVAIFDVTVPRLKGFRNRKIEADFTVDDRNQVIVQKVQGIKPGLLDLNLTHRAGSEGRGFSGTITLLKPSRGLTAQSTTAQPSGSVAATMFTSAVYSSAPQNYKCSLQQGFEFNADLEDTFGYVTNIEIAGTNIPSDLNVSNPSGPQTTQSVVGVLQSVNWSGGPTDPVQLSFNVGVQNNVLLTTLIESVLPSNVVSFEFAVYQFNMVTNQYYKSFFTASALTGTITSNSDGFELHIDDVSDSQVLIPLNFQCNISIDPSTVDTQYFQKTTGTWAPIAEPWGPTN